MVYENIKKGIFLARPNRFIAHVAIDGKNEVVHVKNTGRCKELLTDRATVFCQEVHNPRRKTKFDLISVVKNDRLINMDSNAPNKVFLEYLQAGKLFQNIKLIKPECKYNNSRFDFYVETDTDKIFIEVKGVTLEENGVVLFPDAPTLRGVKHINELIQAQREGYKACIVFVIQMDTVQYFTPNNKTHPEFGQALAEARKNGVSLLALDCSVTEHTLAIQKKVRIQLQNT